MTELERAKKHLDAWLKADLAVSTGQSYSMGSRSLTRANVSEIQKQIKFWEGRVALLASTGGKPQRRSKRFIPRDL